MTSLLSNRCLRFYNLIPNLEWIIKTSSNSFSTFLHSSNTSSKTRLRYKCNTKPLQLLYYNSNKHSSCKLCHRWAVRKATNPSIAEGSHSSNSYCRHCWISHNKPRFNSSHMSNHSSRSFNSNQLVRFHKLRTSQIRHKVSQVSNLGDRMGHSSFFLSMRS